MGEMTLSGASPAGNARPLGLAGADLTRGDIDPEPELDPPVCERCRLEVDMRGERCGCWNGEDEPLFSSGMDVMLLLLLEGEWFG